MGKLEAVCTSVHKLCAGLFVCFSVCVNIWPLFSDWKDTLMLVSHHNHRLHVNTTTAYVLGFSLITLLQFSSQLSRHIDFNCFTHLSISKECNRLVSSQACCWLSLLSPFFCPHTQINRKQSLLSNEVGIPLCGVQEDIKGKLSLCYHQLLLSWSSFYCLLSADLL